MITFIIISAVLFVLLIITLAEYSKIKKGLNQELLSSLLVSIKNAKLQTYKDMSDRVVRLRIPKSTMREAQISRCNAEKILVEGCEQYIQEDIQGDLFIDILEKECI